MFSWVKRCWGRSSRLVARSTRVFRFFAACASSFYFAATHELSSSRYVRCLARHFSTWVSTLAAKSQLCLLLDLILDRCMHSTMISCHFLLELDHYDLHLSLDSHHRWVAVTSLELHRMMCSARSNISWSRRSASSFLEWLFSNKLRHCLLPFLKS